MTDRYYPKYYHNREDYYRSRSRDRHYLRGRDDQRRWERAEDSRTPSRSPYDDTPRSHHRRSRSAAYSSYRSRSQSHYSEDEDGYTPRDEEGQTPPDHDKTSGKNQVQKEQQSSSDSRQEQDAGHFEYYVGKKIGGHYKIINHLGDGTFGRTLKCSRDKNYYAIKIIRAVKRYNQSAKIEVNILNDVKKRGGTSHNLVHMYESFTHKEYHDQWHARDHRGHEEVVQDCSEHTCMVFETLGKSLYEFIKGNRYYGFALHQIQSIARQSLEGIDFMHSKMGLTHTDLKPENILLKLDSKK